MIATAKQYTPTQVYVYDEKGNFMFAKAGILVGFTSTTLSIKDRPDSSQVKVYDERGNFKFSR